MSSPLTGTFEDVSGENRALARKMTKMALFLAKDTVDPVETIVDNSNQLVIPAGYESAGHISRDQGAAITPSIEISELMAYNDGQPIRRDLVSDTTALAVTLLESKRIVWELYYSQDLSGIQVSAGPKNEYKFDKADMPDLMEWRVLLLGRDGRGANAIYHAEHFLLMTQSDRGARTWSPTEGFTWSVTLSALTDDAAGTPQRSFWAGPGLTNDKIAAMGLTRAGA